MVSIGDEDNLAIKSMHLRLEEILWPFQKDDTFNSEQVAVLLYSCIINPILQIREWVFLLA